MYGQPAELHPLYNPTKKPRVFVCAFVQVVVPNRFCDDRVQVLQADARLLTPAVLEQYTTDVSTQQPRTASRADTL